MKNLNTFLAILVFFTACGTSGGSEEGILLEGKIKNPSEDGIVVLQSATRNPEALDTIEVTDGRFSQKVDVDPGFYQLNLYDKQFINLILNKSDLEIEADGTADGESTVKGSADMEGMAMINDLIDDYQQRVTPLQEEFMTARTEKDEEKMKQLQEEFASYNEEFRSDVKKIYGKLEPGLAMMYGMNYLDPNQDFPFIDSIAGIIKKEFPDLQMVQDFVAQIEQMRSLSIGTQAPDISLPTPAGDTVTLSSLRGKYVLIDFWASWCKPCRVENPHVVEMYEKYKDDGFEIYAVSLDREKGDWEKAIEDDGLTWVHVSDLKYFNSEAAALYKIQAIPATVLLDPEGKIIAKNLRGETLEKKLEEIFKS